MAFHSIVTAILVSTIILVRGISAHKAIKKTIKEWQKSGSCPRGTVPILRTPPRNTSIATDFMFPFPKSGGFETMDDFQHNAEWAIAYTTKGPYDGAEGVIDMWDIHVEPNEFSSNFILVASTAGKARAPPDKPPQDVQNVIAAGWTANPLLYGDTKPRLYLAWTNDAQGHKTCWNFDCGGFIQTSDHLVFGAAPPSASQPGGISDGALPKWWIAFGDEDVGYILDDSFSDFGQADYTMWGGLVKTTNPGGKHTTTQMGSGRNVDSGVGFAGMIREYLTVGFTGELIYNPPSGSVVTHPKCYGYKGLGEAKNYFGYYILYGGPGGPSCDK
uniref:Neprosin PEP catalytic domain-containing protein n=1 Tax=Ananas comosus var. bracteatus TaxID=296719 RepID=A0A6V7NVW3_ANACO|nr:unnamed protein product [Ananas comosus var. bracteatus]